MLRFFRLPIFPTSSTTTTTTRRGIFQASSVYFASVTSHYTPQSGDGKTIQVDLNFPRTFTEEQKIRSTRNFGIIAHIDAGKTTTTERMLFYAGMQKRIGEVDKGNTTTDFMPEEMERGISITAAAVSFWWSDHKINLIDTPGHVDFSVEVQRSMRVVDGVVVVFDAKVGVQAQSYTVLHMARLNKAPTIAFMNKMDKPDANFELAVKTIRDKLGCHPLLMQLPLRASTGECVGIIDFAEGKVVTFQGEQGEIVSRRIPTEEYILEQLRGGRSQLITFLAEHSAQMMETYLNLLEQHAGDEKGAEDAVTAKQIYAATKELLLRGADAGAVAGSDILRIMPVLLGASRRNVGVQTLMDAVIQLLPCPLDRPRLTGIGTDNTTSVEAPDSLHPHVLAFAFKVVHFPDPKKQNELCPFVFFRVFCGKIKHGSVLHNRRSKTAVKMDRLYTLQADRLSPANEFSSGSVGGAFLNDVLTGDTLAEQHVTIKDHKFLEHQRRVQAARNKHAKSRHHQQQQLADKNANAEDDDDDNDAAEAVQFGAYEPLNVPPSVLSHAIEASSTRLIESLRGALQRIEVEDPSLRVSENQFGQLVVSGMGELHLEIVLSRLRREYQISCDLTKAFVCYREGVKDPVVIDDVSAVADGNVLFSCDVEVRPIFIDSNTDKAFQKSFNNLSLPDESCCVADCSHLVFTDEAAASWVASAAKKKATAGSGGNDDDDADGSFSSSSGGGGAGGAAEKKAKEQLKTIKRLSNDFLNKVLKMGPMAKVEMDGVEIRILKMSKKAATWDIRELETAITVFLSTIMRRIGKNNSILLEPIMKLQIHLTDSQYSSGIVGNLSQKQALSVEIEAPDERSTEITAIVPLRFITKYSKEARAVAKGNIYFWSELAFFRRVSDEALEAKIMKTLT